MKTIKVTTKHELEKAKDAGYEEIHIIGELADQMHRSKKIAYASTGVLAALAAAPFTVGGSMIAGASVAAMTGFEIAAIIAATSVGLTLLLAVFKDYEEVSYCEGSFVLKKKQS